MTSANFSAKKFISQKRDGNSHSAEDLKTWLSGYLKGSVPDYQMSAWLMAVFFKGMKSEELSVWTDLMASSGAKLPRRDNDGFWVDKHSTGGVGDKPSLLLVPLVISVAARLWGKGKLRIPMMSGRGLGHSGGTLDKLESIPGFRTQLNREESAKNLAENDFVMMGQTEDLVPADRRLYALRDVTATVESLPLIVSSILSKKLSESLNGLVLDVKFGSGAFMKDKEKARQLAQSLVQVAKLRGVKSVAWLTRMDEPVGYAVGNALEIEECIEFLTGECQEEGLAEVTLALAATMLEISSGGTLSYEAAHAEVTAEIKTPRPLAVFEKMVQAQGGDLEAFHREKNEFLNHYQVLVYKSETSGTLKVVEALKLGEISLFLGAGRELSDATIDPWAGVRLHKKVGDKVEAGEVLCELFFKRDLDRKELQQRLSGVFEISKGKVEVTPWCAERLG